MVVIPSQRRHSTEKQGASGGEQHGDEDGASYRGIAAAYRAAGEPGGEAEHFSSSARHMGRPPSDPRGDNASDESKDADHCLDGDDNVFGAGEGLTRCG